MIEMFQIGTGIRLDEDVRPIRSIVDKLRNATTGIIRALIENAIGRIKHGLI